MIKKLVTNVLKNSDSTNDTTHQDTEIKNDNDNTLGDVFQAIKRALLTVREEINNPDSPPFFKTIAIDTGQFERLMSERNTEFETTFPACFVRFTNVHFLVAQQRIGEGRGIVRIRFILNKLDNQHVNWETYPFYIAERVNKAIQDAKDIEEALQERCNLMYFDMPQSTRMLQPYWLDYEIYFRITSSYKYNDWIRKKIITPPFTNNSDVPNDKEDVDIPTYDDSTSIDDGMTNPDSIQVLPQQNRLELGRQMVLRVVFIPDDVTNKNVSFKSSDEGKALVSKNGVVTAVGVGPCKIIVTTANGIVFTKELIIYAKTQA